MSRRHVLITAYRSIMDIAYFDEGSPNIKYTHSVVCKKIKCDFVKYIE